MSWYLGMVFSMLFIVASIVVYIIKRKKNPAKLKGLEENVILMIGLGFTAFSLLFPVFLNSLPGGCSWVEAIFVAIQGTLRLFFVDGEYVYFVGNIGTSSSILFSYYSVVFGFLCVFAPFLTFDFVLSFFKNASAYKDYFLHSKTDVYAFSEINERSLAFAESVYKSNEKALLIFTDVFSENNERNFEMIEKAKSMNAILFKNDIVTINFGWHSKKSEIKFLLIGDDQTENLNQTMKIAERYKYREKTNVYLFTYQKEAELLLARVYRDEDGDTDPAVKIEIRCINDVQSLIYRTLYVDGYENIFGNAFEDENDLKHINAVIIGMGQHGTEMTKALSWFGQMYGYRLSIDCFDKNENAQGVFESECPELMDAEHNNNFSVDGEAQYKITIHSGVDVKTKSFDDIITSLERPTYVFVCLGNDETNISISIKINELLERKKYSPVIQSIVYNSDKKDALLGIKKYNAQPYSIDFLGDIRTSYDRETVLNATVYRKALKKHISSGYLASDFWHYSYCSKSTVARLIHDKMKKLCDVPGAKIVDPKKRKPVDREKYRILEHRRWNAYTRSEGYVYGGTVENWGRCDLSKKHNCLTDYYDLPPEIQARDD